MTEKTPQQRIEYDVDHYISADYARAEDVVPHPNGKVYAVKAHCVHAPDEPWERDRSTEQFYLWFPHLPDRERLTRVEFDDTWPPDLDGETFRHFEIDE